MTQEEKNLNNLLLKDLCARLPYGVKCFVNYIICNETTDYEDVKSSTVDTLVTINQQTEKYFFEWLCEWFDIDEFKPYLFPLSSMTEEQKYDFYCRFIENDCDFNDFKEFYFENNEWHKMLTSIDDIEEIIDWFNKNHFDFRCLIPKGLAIDASGLNIY